MYFIFLKRKKQSKKNATKCSNIIKIYNKAKIHIHKQYINIQTMRDIKGYEFDLFLLKKKKNLSKTATTVKFRTAVFKN